MEIVEAINKIVSLSAPNIHEDGHLQYTDKKLSLLYPPSPDAVKCSTLQGLVDLYGTSIDDVGSGTVLFHITSPTTVEMISKVADEYGRRRVWAEAKYPECQTFPFGSWLNPESFIIAAQQGFQRVKVENDDGSFVKDLDYVLQIASKITGEQSVSHDDDGFAQRVTVKQGVALKTETTLRPMVQLAPYRTFAEIDQVLSQFVFRARIQSDSPQLALFEGDGGRWKLGAAANIKAWLKGELAEADVIS
jgi:hypothetical protein